jgi:hypothetical protein
MPTMAADHPQAEVFGGYQYTRFEGGENANGWNAAGTVNLNRWLGVTADFSGVYTSEDGVKFPNYTYTFGPTVSLRGAPMSTPFAQALFGGVHSSAAIAAGGANVRASDSGFAAAGRRRSCHQFQPSSGDSAGAGGWDVVAQLGRHKQQQCPDLGRNRL